MAQSLARYPDELFSLLPWLGSLVIMALLRSIAQGVQSQSSVTTTFNWISQHRLELLSAIKKTSFPAYRNTESIRASLEIYLESIRTGCLAWFSTSLATTQLLLLLPLLFLFPWSLGTTVIILALPILMLSRLRIKALRGASDQWLKTTKTSRLKLSLLSSI